MNRFLTRQRGSVIWKVTYCQYFWGSQIFPRVIFVWSYSLKSSGRNSMPHQDTWTLLRYISRTTVKVSCGIYSASFCHFKQPPPLKELSTLEIPVYSKGSLVRFSAENIFLDSFSEVFSQTVQSTLSYYLFHWNDSQTEIDFRRGKNWMEVRVISKFMLSITITCKAAACLPVCQFVKFL